MHKPSRREKREARRLIELAKRGKPPTHKPAMQMAAKQMAVHDPQWDGIWTEIKFLDERIAYLESLVRNPTSEGVVVVADEMLATIRRFRDSILQGREFRPATLSELYTGVSYAHRYL